MAAVGGIASAFVYRTRSLQAAGRLNPEACLTVSTTGSRAHHCDMTTESEMCLPYVIWNASSTHLRTKGATPGASAAAAALRAEATPQHRV